MPIFELERAGSRRSQWGEGPTFHEGRLLYVDIEGHDVIILDPTDESEKVIPCGERVGTVVPRLSGGLVIAGDNGFSAVDPDTGAVTPMTDPEADQPGNRFNDGKCDPAGRLWAGSISLDRKPEAALYRLDTEGVATKMFGPVTNSNGLCWSADKATMFYIDTPRKEVTAFDFDNAAGEISNQRQLVDTSALDGVPDGMTIDADGNLWVAMCKGSTVRCFSSQDGALIHTIDMPTNCPTAAAFGGDDLGTLFITTGQHSSAPDDENSGYLYAYRPGVQGVPAFSYAG